MTNTHTDDGPAYRDPVDYTREESRAIDTLVERGWRVLDHGTLSLEPSIEQLLARLMDESGEAERAVLGRVVSYRDNPFWAAESWGENVSYLEMYIKKGEADNALAHLEAAERARTRLLSMLYALLPELAHISESDTELALRTRGTQSQIEVGEDILSDAFPDGVD